GEFSTNVPAKSAALKENIIHSSKMFSPSIISTVNTLASWTLLMERPVSSRYSRLTASAIDSPLSIFPPGATHQPLLGFCSNKTRSLSIKKQFVTRRMDVTPNKHTIHIIILLNHFSHNEVNVTNKKGHK